MLSGALRAHVNNATQFFSRARSDNDCFFPWLICPSSSCSKDLIRSSSRCWII